MKAYALLSKKDGSLIQFLGSCKDILEAWDKACEMVEDAENIGYIEELKKPNFTFNKTWKYEPKTWKYQPKKFVYKKPTDQ